jgi:hypothetical protein
MLEMYTNLKIGEKKNIHYSFVLLCFKDIRVKVVVLINDTVGTLMSTAYYDPKTAVGFIIGTGTNG